MSRRVPCLSWPSLGRPTLCAPSSGPGWKGLAGYASVAVAMYPPRVSDGSASDGRLLASLACTVHVLHLQ